jgi:hypothetical protein
MAQNITGNASSNTDQDKILYTSHIGTTNKCNTDGSSWTSHSTSTYTLTGNNTTPVAATTYTSPTNTGAVTTNINTTDKAKDTTEDSNTQKVTTDTQGYRAQTYQNTKRTNSQNRKKQNSQI